MHRIEGIKKQAATAKYIILACVSTRHSLLTDILGIFRTEADPHSYSISLTLALDCLHEILTEALSDKPVGLQ
ncbi:MAG: hypothetical protein FGM27_09790 [Candidatus Omnitrophica bacterium]|nr:hypothetical protein [Candidatus Omnitrophota bacterium]